MERVNDPDSSRSGLPDTPFLDLSFPAQFGIAAALGTPGGTYDNVGQSLQSD